MNTIVWTTVTPPRQHLQVVEMEHEYGYRFWSKPMREEAVSAYIEEYRNLDYGLSDIDCSVKCWCSKGE